MPVITGTVTNYLTKLTPFRATEDHHIPRSQRFLCVSLKVSVTPWVPKVTEVLTKKAIAKENKHQNTTPSFPRNSAPS